MCRYKILDLFCGAGGFSYGMHRNSNFKTYIALDNDSHVVDTFKRNMPNTDVIVGDITNLEVKREVINKSMRCGINMIIGGPPCQGYALKGKKLGLNDPRNYLFREYLDIVKQVKPEVFVIENVKSILSTANGWFRDEIVKSIQSLGYKVEYGILNASRFGVPQSRERAFFICARHNSIPLPEPKMIKPVTVRDAISDLSYLDSGEGEFAQSYRLEPSSNYQLMMRSKSKNLYNHQASNHKQVAIEKLKMIPPEKGREYLPDSMKGRQKYNSTWSRLRWDEVSPTIDTRFDAASNGRNNHPFLHRAITPREAARLQSFDDSFVFLGTKVHIRKQIGNAVPPLLAKAIADQIERIMSNNDEEISRDE